MNLARLAVLVVAVGAAGGAVLIGMANRAPKTTEQAPVVMAPVATDDVLIAAQDLSLGTITAATDFAWQPWPKDAVNPVMIKKSEDDKALVDLTGSIVRANIIKGEPIRRERLIKGQNSGFLAAILPTGMRAVAINIDSQGATTAGNFIHPGDKIDVVRTIKPDGSGQAGSELRSETLLRNIKVLAIGPTVEDKNGQPTVTGSTATLELDPVQSELIILAQRTGQLSLVLRSILDSAPTATEPDDLSNKSTTIVRFGVPTETANR